MSPDALRIVSYNVRYFGHALRGLASTLGSKLGIAAGLASLDPLPDVVCLQEVETLSVRSTLLTPRSHARETQLETFMDTLEATFSSARRRFPYEAFYFRAHAFRLADVPVYTTGLAMLVNLDRLQVQSHNTSNPSRITHHHVARFRDRKQIRICSHIALADPHGRRFHVFNTHLSLPTPFTRAFWSEKDKMGHGINQLHEARTLANFVHHHAGHEPFLVTGDFNSPPASPVYRLLTEDARWIGAQEAIGQIDPRSPRGFPTAGFLRLRMHLDHLFASRGVHWRDLEGTLPFGQPESPFHGLSDHVPLIARFELPAPQP